MAGFRRDMNNLYGDARTAGAEFGAKLIGFRFSDAAPMEVSIDYRFDLRRPGDVPIDRICEMLRSLGWRCSISKREDGSTAIVVTVDAG